MQGFVRLWVKSLSKTGNKQKKSHSALFCLDINGWRIFRQDYLLLLFKIYLNQWEIFAFEKWFWAKFGIGTIIFKFINFSRYFWQFFFMLKKNTRKIEKDLFKVPIIINPLKKFFTPKLLLLLIYPKKCTYII